MHMTYTLGIDLHKRSSVWVLINDEKEVVKKLTVPSTRESVPGAIAQLGISTHMLRAAIEPVCGWRWYSEELEKHGLMMSIANPAQVRLIADSKQKHDAYDARMLAELLHINYLPTAYRAPDAVVALRALVRERAFLVHVQTSIKSRIHGITLRNGNLEGATHALRSAQREHLIAADEEIRRLFDLLKEVGTYIKPLEKKLESIVRTHPICKILTSMRGIGIVTASAICAEVGDFSRFSSGERLASYAGLVPSQRSSGQTTRMGHITKQGSGVLRYSMVEAAFRVRAQHPLYPFYERLAPKIGKKRARVALARKMLVILWHMVRDNKTFDPIHCMTKRSDLASAFLTH